MPRPDANAHRTAVASQLPEVLHFMQVLWTVVHGLEKGSKRMAAIIGVTGPQRLVVRVAGLFPGLSAGDLAAILRVHPSTLTGVLRRLVDQGLLVRVSDPEDRRRAVLRLTPKGERINAVRRGTVEAVVAKALGSVSGRDQVAATRLLEQLAREMDLALSTGAVGWNPPRRRSPVR